MAAVFDVVLEDTKPVLDTVERYPLAAVTAASLPRSTLELDVASALAAESAAQFRPTYANVVLPYRADRQSRSRHREVVVAGRV